VLHPLPTREQPIVDAVICARGRRQRKAAIVCAERYVTPTALDEHIRLCTLPKRHATMLTTANGMINTPTSGKAMSAPVLTKEMRGAEVMGWAEIYEPRDKARARITLWVIGLAICRPRRHPIACA
jgi:hypothetical protein